jgi:hypothetical protein
MPREEPIIALFDDRAQALRLRDELRATGMPERAMTIMAPASDHADVVGALVELGIGRADAALFADEVCGGATLLTVCPAETERERVAEIIARHAPTRTGRPQAITDAIPGDASSERAPDVTPMPTGSGSLESRPDPVEDDEQ